MPHFAFVDLFCGAGGLALGFKKAGFELLDATDIDLDRVTWFNQYVERYKARPVDLTTVTAKDMLEEIGGRRPDVVTGAPPTKPFSRSGHKLGAEDDQYLIDHFLRLAIGLQPRVIVMDTVADFLKPKWTEERTMVLNQLSAAGYTVQCQTLNAADHGVPQNRKHGYIVAVRDMLWQWPWPSPCGRTVSMAEVLDDLLPTLKEHPLPGWLAELEYPAAGALLVSGKNRNKWGNQWYPFDGPAFTMTESAGNRHRIRDYCGRWLALNGECFRRLQGFPQGFDQVDQEAVTVATPPPLAEAVACMVRDGLESL